MSQLLSHLMRAVELGVIKLCSLLPVRQKTIVLRSVPDFSDNTHAFYEYMRREHADEGYTLVWLIKDPSKYADKATKNIRFVRAEGRGLLLKRDYYLAVAKFVLFTHSAPIRQWRKKQCFIDTTHSASQLKGGDIRPKDEVRTVVPDYRLRCGPDGLERKMRILNLPADKFRVLGMPRLDILFRHRDCLSKLFPEVKPKKTVIAMETFKQNFKGWKDSTTGRSYGLNILANADELEALDTELKAKEILLIIKPHPLQDLSYIEMSRLDNIRFITDADLAKAEIQLYELLENCDGLLTDYSSIYYDFLLLDRPIGFLIGDMADYERGFIIPDPLSEMTGPKIRTLSELIAYFDDLLAGRDDYGEERAALIKRVFVYPDDKNCERLYNFLLGLMNQ